MNIYDKAHGFAKDLKNLQEIVDYREATNKINENSKNKKMVEDFRKIQIEAYSEQMNTGKLSEEMKKKMQDFGAIAMTNADVANYLRAEAKFGALWEDIMKILNEAVGVNVIAPTSK